MDKERYTYPIKNMVQICKCGHINCSYNIVYNYGQKLINKDRKKELAELKRISNL